MLISITRRERGVRLSLLKAALEIAPKLSVVQPNFGQWVGLKFGGIDMESCRFLDHPQ